MIKMKQPTTMLRLAESLPLAQISALQQYLLASSYYPAEQVLSPEPFQLDSSYPTGSSLSPGSPPANLPSFNNYYSAESQSSLNTHNIYERRSNVTWNTTFSRVSIFNNSISSNYFRFITTCSRRTFLLSRISIFTKSVLLFSSSSARIDHVLHA